MEKLVNLEKVYELLTKLSNSSELPMDDRILLWRFVDKLSDSKSFADQVVDLFGFKKYKSIKIKVQKSISDKLPIELKCGFRLIPIKSNWILYKDEEIFLDSISDKLALKISLDINVAFLIKLKQKIYN